MGQTARKNASEFLDSVPETWDFVVDLNLMVTFYVTWTVAKGMKERGFGRIVNISSDSTLVGERSIVDYVAAKSGVSGFTRGLARELAPFGITVNAVAPGVTNTRGPKQLPKEVYDAALAEIPLGHLAEPEDIANAITFLASQGGALHHRTDADRQRRPDLLLRGARCCTIPEATGSITT